MGLLNYTTRVDWRKSVQEIIGMLVAAKVSAVMQEYDGAQYVTALAFKAQTPAGEMAFRLPVNVQAVQTILVQQHKARRIDRRFANDATHARNVAWRITSQWVEAQVALIEIGMVKVEQVFLPYAQNAQGVTLYEALAAQKFSGLALPATGDGGHV